MANFLTDTDIFADFFHNQAYAKNLIKELNSKGRIYVSILSIAELKTGFSSQQSKYFLPKLYKLAKVANLTIETAELSGELRGKYRKDGISLSTVDTLIAATAILNNYELVTRSTKDYPMPEVKIYKL